MRGRQFERARATDAEHGRKQQFARDGLPEQCSRDHQRADRIDCLRRAHDGAAVVAIRGMADDQRQNHRRDKLN